MDSVIATLKNFAEDPIPAACVAVGGLKLLSVLLGLLGYIYKWQFRPSFKVTKFGKYAVITGATDGIGKAYAFALAKRGMSIILISRTESKLQEVAKEIDAKNFKGIEKTKYIVCDYSNFDQKTRDSMEKDLKDLDVGILINNVGQSYRYPRFFHELPKEEIGALMEMNINSTVWMTKMVIDGMVERRRGHIVNISSGSADYSMPLLAEYASAKMFVERFSESLDAEYRQKGIRVQCQIPFYVATKLAKLRKSFTVPTAEEYVWLAMRWIGQSGTVSPFWAHALQGWVMNALPKPFVESGVMSMHAGIRKRGLKKDAKIAAEGKNQ
ncbi:hypothetical protein ACHAWT_003919 [Skeletonema menzelii]|eukprot:scaffold31016_cov166-Skeletonema_menzelii.AAC.4